MKREHVHGLVFVGQAPGPSGDPEKPLEGNAGLRLADCLGVSYEAFLAHDRVNLLPVYPGPKGGGSKGDAFPMEQAVVEAQRIMRQFRGRRVVMLGHQVGRAFGLHRSVYFQIRPCDAFEWCAVIPHPSGVNRWWNLESNCERARTELRKMAAL